MTRLVSILTTVMAEKENDTDSTATVTTAAATLVSASEWDDDIVATLESSTTWNEQIYVLRKRRWVKPDRKWKTPTPRASSKENHTKIDKTVNAQSREIDGFFMFGCAAREMTKIRCFLMTLQELSTPRTLLRLEKNQKGAKAMVKNWQIQSEDRGSNKGKLGVGQY